MRRLVLLLLVIAVGALGTGFVGFVATVALSGPPAIRHADGLVVLTGGADRVTDASALLADGVADRLLITGVNPSTSPADLAHRVPRLLPLVDCCVTLGYAALDTAGNARETADWVAANNIRTLIVVTSDYHMPRALAEIRQAVRGVDLLAYPVMAEGGREETWWSTQRARLIVSEYLKYIVVLARNRLVPHASGPTVVAERSP